MKNIAIFFTSLLLVFFSACSFAENENNQNDSGEGKVCASCPIGKCAFIFNFSNLRANESVQVLAGETKALKVKPCDELAITVVLGKQIPSFVVAPCRVSVAQEVNRGDKIILEGTVTDPVAMIKSNDCDANPKEE